MSITLYEVLYGYNYGSKLNCNVVKVGVSLTKTIAHIKIQTQQCFLEMFLDYDEWLQRILLQFEVYITFEPSEHSKLHPSPNYKGSRDWRLVIEQLS